MKTLFHVRLRLLALLACVAAVMYACNEDAPVAVTDPVSLTGVVLDGEGHAVPGAVLEVHNVKPSIQSVIAYDTTDDYGNFSLGDLPNGGSGLYVRVSHPYYQSFVGGFGDVMSGALDGQVKLLLHNSDSCCGTLALTVIDSANSGALQGVEVKLRTGGARIAVGTTDALGRIVFHHVCAGQYNFRLAKQGFRVVEEDVAIENCDSVGFNIVMRTLGHDGNDSCCNGVATVIIRDSLTNAQLGGSTVKLRKNGALLTTLTTNNDGFVRFTGLCPGQYSLLIQRDGYGAREVNFTAECNDSLEIARKLLAIQNNEDSCCHGVIRVVVRDSSTNAIVVGAKVKIWKGNVLKAQETTGQNGAVIGGLCEGSYGVNISRDGYAPVEFDVRLACNDTIDIVKYILAKSGGQDTCCNNRIKILVRDTLTNQAIPNATVKLWKNGALVKTLTANNDGYVVFEELCQGTYGISITRDTYKGRELQVQVSCNSNEIRTVLLVSEHSNNDSCCHGVIRMAVRDSTTNAILGSTSMKLWKGNQHVATETANGDGVVFFRNLCAGRYVVNISRDGYNGREVVVELGCNDTSLTTQRILAKNIPDSCQTAKLKVRVKDSTVADGGWLAGAAVVIRRNGVVVAQGTTNADGWYMGEGLLAPAEYSVTVSKDGYESKTVTFVFNECKTIQETLRIVPD